VGEKLLIFVLRSLLSAAGAGQRVGRALLKQLSVDTTPTPPREARGVPRPLYGSGPSGGPLWSPLSARRAKMFASGDMSHGRALPLPNALPAVPTPRSQLSQGLDQPTS
jgi:hypothetical protein